MENASKALLIAGAVLIVILLISVGIMIFNSSKGLFSSATTSMTEQEQMMFNTKFTMYEGTNISGTQVRELIRSVITNNTNEDNPAVKINDSEITATTDATKLPGATPTTITTTGRYTVQCIRNSATGLIDNITITLKTNTAS